VPNKIHMRSPAQRGGGARPKLALDNWRHAEKRRRCAALIAPTALTTPPPLTPSRVGGDAAEPVARILPAPACR